ncbi:MAG: OmpA family protein [Desulfobacterales bacterium]|nr:OmpA family protein [Desulfobacterales bacterium]
MKKYIGLSIVILVGLLLVMPAHAQEDLEVVAPAGAVEFSYKYLDANKLLVSAADGEGNPLRDLTGEDFVLMRGGKQAQILSAEPLETSKDVSLNIVMVVDNSASMRRRNAIQPIIRAMENLYAIIRPIDNITVVVFSDRDTMAFGDYNLHVRMKQSNQIEELRDFIRESFDAGLTNKTVVYEGMLAGLSVLHGLPEDTNKFMVVFTDGEDINSAFRGPVVEKAAEGLANFEAYAIDYMPRSGTDPFLRTFSESHGGRIWKATAAEDLVPIFQAVMSKLLYRYVVTYRFLYPPSGTLALAPAVVNVEEITTIDSAPLLNYIYFDTGQSAIPERYVRFRGQDQTAAFDSAELRSAQEKYLNVLNIVGRRLTAFPTANIRIVGCNGDMGEEKGRIDLSRARAESVKAYLQYIWGIDPARMTVEARNLPEVPSSRGTPEGRQENQRVEIHADRDEILDVVTSTYAEARMDAEALQVQPRIISEHGVYSWKLTISGDGSPIHSMTGSDTLAETLPLPADKFTPLNIASYKQLTAEIEVEDMEGQFYTAASDPLTVNFLQREERRARNLGYKVQEKYALILFDFNSDAIKARNEVIVRQIVARIDTLPDVSVNIVGHTDNIGKEEYNLDLSERRARAVFDQISAVRGDAAGEAFKFSGVGPFDPLFTNDLPENRALNRTVTITLLYEQKE